MLYLLKKSMYSDADHSSKWAPHTKHYQHLEFQRIATLFRDSAEFVGEVGAQRYFNCLQNFDRSKKYVIDPYNGAPGGGLTEIPKLPYPIGLFRCLIGDVDSVIPNAFFDLTFSISVIEHIGQAETKFDRKPTDDPPPEQEQPRTAFCRDLFRITKPGGLTIHSVDHAARNRTYCLNFLAAGFELIEDVDLPSLDECMHDPNNIKQMTKWGSKSHLPSDDTDWPLDSVLIMGFRRPII